MKELLQSLVAVSPSAKAAALRAGLVHRIASELRRVTDELSVGGSASALAPDGHWASAAAAKKHEPKVEPRMPSEKRKASTAVQRQRLSRAAWELRHLLATLANLLHGSQDVQSAVIASSVPKALESLWATCELDDAMMQLLIEVCCNFVVGSIDAVRSLALPASNKSSIVRRGAKLACRLLKAGEHRKVLPVLLEFLAEFAALVCIAAALA